MGKGVRTVLVCEASAGFTIQDTLRIIPHGPNFQRQLAHRCRSIRDILQDVRWHPAAAWICRLRKTCCAQ